MGEQGCLEEGDNVRPRLLSHTPLLEIGCLLNTERNELAADDGRFAPKRQFLPVRAGWWTLVAHLDEDSKSLPERCKVSAQEQRASGKQRTESTVATAPSS